MNDPKLSAFVEAACTTFETMLGGDTAGGREKQIILNIEELWLNREKSSLLNNHIGFTARIAVAIIHEGDTVKAGYLQHTQEADVPGNVQEHQADLQPSPRPGSQNARGANGRPRLPGRG